MIFSDHFETAPSSVMDSSLRPSLPGGSHSVPGKTGHSAMKGLISSSISAQSSL